MWRFCLAALTAMLLAHSAAKAGTVGITGPTKVVHGVSNTFYVSLDNSSHTNTSVTAKVERTNNMGVGSPNVPATTNSVGGLDSPVAVSITLSSYGTFYLRGSVDIGGTNVGYTENAAALEVEVIAPPVNASLKANGQTNITIAPGTQVNFSVEIEDGQGDKPFTGSIKDNNSNQLGSFSGTIDEDYYDGSGSASYTFNTSGTYTITAEIVHVGNTSYSNSVTVTVETADLAATLTADSTSVTTIDPVIFTANITNGKPDTAFSVVFKSGSTTLGTDSGTTNASGAGTATLSHTFTTSGSYPVTAEVTCDVKTATTTATTITVTDPPMTVTLTPDRSAVTTLESITFTVNIAYGAAAAEYTVDLTDASSNPVGTQKSGTTNSSGTGTATITHTFATAGTYVVKATVAQGGPGVDSATTTVVISEPVLAAALTVDKTSATITDIVTFTVNVTNGSASTAFTADLTDASDSPIGTQGSGSTNTSGAGFTTVTHTFTMPGTYVVKAKVIQGIKNVNSGSQTITVTDPNAMTSTLTANKNSTNTSSAVTFTATIAKGEPNASFTVTFKDGATTLGTATGTTDASGAGTASYTHTFASSGSYSVTAAVTQSSKSATSAPEKFTVNNNPNALDVSIVCDDPSAPAGTPVSFTATVAYATPGAFTVKFYDGTTYLGEGSGTIDPSGSGTATYTLNTGFSQPGTHNITARFTQGTVYFNTDSVPVVVNASDLPDPTKDAEVVGLMNAQHASVDRILRIQTGNIRNRLGRLRGESSSDTRSNSFSMSFNNTTSYGRNDRRGEARPSGSASTTFASNTANASPLSLPPVRHWSFWGESMLSIGTDRKNGNDNDHTTFGGTIGVDRFFGRCFAAGVALGYAHDQTDVGSNGSESRGEAYTASLYASYAHPTGFYIDGVVGYSRLELESTRYTTEGFARSDRGGNQYFTAMEAGYDFRSGNFTFSPYGRMDASTSRLDRYSERGGGRLNLTYDSTDINLFSLTAGVRSQYVIDMCWGNLVPSAGVEYRHNFRETSEQRMGYVSQGSLPYLLNSKTLGNNQFGANAGVYANFDGGWRVGGEYRGTYSASRSDHTFYVSLSRSW